MDQKQFDLLQTTLQWVADEDPATEYRLSRVTPGVVHHYQGNYGNGVTEDSDANVEGVREGFREQYRLVCPSNACVAGNAVLIHGDRFVVPAFQHYTHEHVMVNQCIDTEGEVHTINTRAARLLGLSYAESRRLFDGDLSRKQVLNVGRMIATTHGYTLEVL